MRIQIFKNKCIDFVNVSYKLYMSENNIYLAYYNKKSIKYGDWIYGKDRNFIEISKKSYDKIFTK